MPGEDNKILKLMEDKVQDHYRTAAAIIQNEIARAVVTKKVIVYSVTDKKIDYSDLSNAKEQMLTGVTAKSEDAAQGSEELKKAVELWENALKEADYQNKKARINTKVAGFLYYNCALAYLLLNDFENANRTAAEARKNEATDSEAKELQEFIADTYARYKANQR